MSQYALHTVFEEIWRPLLDDSRYEASNLGRVRSVTRTIYKSTGPALLHGRILKQQRTSTGYCIFGPVGGNRLVSREVLRAFTGIAGDGLQACHRDGDKSNNSLPNLRWDTQIGNEADKIIHGTLLTGDRHWAAKLSNAQVALIKADNRKHREIAKDFGVSRSHVSSIKCGVFRRYG